MKKLERYLTVYKMKKEYNFIHEYAIVNNKDNQIFNKLI